MRIFNGFRNTLVIFRMQQDMMQPFELIETKKEKLRQAPDTCSQCFKLVGTILQNRK